MESERRRGALQRMVERMEAKEAEVDPDEENEEESGGHSSGSWDEESEPGSSKEDESDGA